MSHLARKNKKNLFLERSPLEIEGLSWGASSIALSFSFTFSIALDGGGVCSVCMRKVRHV
jgi:hypothetical protein